MKLKETKKEFNTFRKSKKISLLTKNNGNNNENIIKDANNSNRMIILASEKTEVVNKFLRLVNFFINK
jgi:hypothetical protein